MKYVGYYNGEIGPLEEMKIPILDRAVYFGDGCYDATTFANNNIFAAAQKDDLGTLMQQHTAGDTLSITVARDGQMQTVSLTLGEKNASNTAAQRSANN